MTAEFELQGHRGARGLFPENTLAGFAATLALGVTSIELDVAVTRDGVPVVVHDPALNADIVRGPDGLWLPAPGPALVTLDVAELAGFDVGRLRPGSRFATLFTRQVPQDGARIPTLAEVMALMAGTGVVVDVELKTSVARPELSVSPEAMADAVLAVADAAGPGLRLAVRSFDWRGLRHLRRLRPDLKLAWLTETATDMAAVPGMVAAEAAGTGYRPCWAPAHGGLTEALVALAQALGLRVVPWTVNEPADMARLIDWGVDGLCTDYPDRGRAAMQAAGLALPPAWGPTGPA